MQTIAQKIYAQFNPASGQQPGYSNRLGGKTLYVQACDAGTVLGITLTDQYGNRETVQSVGAGAKLTPAIPFVQVEITTSADANVMFLVTNGDIDVQLTQVGTNVTNSNANPVPVAIVSEPGSPFPVTVTGTVNVSGATLTATNVGINNTDANPVPVTTATSQTPATVAPVPVAANATGTTLLAADATRRAVRFYAPSTNAGPVAIVPAATDAYASAAIVLNPGDFWNETEAPGAAWYASTPTATGGTINLQTVKA
ncbi:hypothetical protein [Burkholderia cepacia]|uniref:Phage tail protein n=1 Tax=Burkholderia cepacia TaxID=292 RepID=A0A8I1APH0_BURCE|nr:hypothetical protein [Burkholderia cepacia]MBA9942162.1 hypothetical protein [Burkholderia cepacia]MBA9990680.1 hypothetical protein [Burkholderia cepacia]MBB0014545.1 hypothetical protein [Burkholderia cepacia]MBB0050775.1 hypothetical protein [Burkholderia cepacia]MBB0051226.1 hypothetical protein [Burkholderia cepacia]